MIQSLESESPPPLSFFPFTHSSPPGSAIKQAGQASFSSGKNLLVSRGDILVRKRRTDLQRHKEDIDVVGDKSDGRLDKVREEASECEGLAGIALDAQSIGRRTGEVGLALEEAEISPAGQNTQPSENSRGVCAENHAADAVQEEEEGGEMLHAHFDQALEDSDGVLGD